MDLSEGLVIECDLHQEGTRFDKPKEECGVVAVVDLNFSSAGLAVDAIAKLSNRGHEATGIAISSRYKIPVIKGFGTAEDVFPDGGFVIDIAHPSKLALAHARYGTQGSNELAAAQPHVFEFLYGTKKYRFAHIHNGNLTNTTELADQIGMKPSDYVSDSQLMGFAFMESMKQVLTESHDKSLDLRKAVRRVLPHLRGAFTGAIMCGEEIIAFSDHHGLKPGMLGALPDERGFMIASEITALEAVNATFIREIEPAEIVRIKIDDNGVNIDSEQWAIPEPARCLLELLYFMRPSTEAGNQTVFGGLGVEQGRVNAGRALGIKEDQELDLSFPIPNSGRPSGEGYSQATPAVNHMPNALSANTLRRTFIENSQDKRAQGVRDKLRADPKILKNARGAGIDDSVIRGTTQETVAKILEEAGISEFHLRIAMGMVISTCRLGVDLGDPNELLAFRVASNLGIDLSLGYSSLTDDEVSRIINGMAKTLGVNSLKFLTPNEIRMHVLGVKAGEFCMGCITGEYPSSEPQVIKISTTPSVTI